MVVGTSRFFTPERTTMIQQFLRFGVVGALGFLWDTGTVYGLRPLLGLGLATLIAYFVAATLNWVINRLWTFRSHNDGTSLLAQWFRFILANSAGFVLNRGTVYTLFFISPLCTRNPVIALACGALAGMFANFTLSRRLVFRHRQATDATISLGDPLRDQAPKNL